MIRRLAEVVLANVRVRRRVPAAVGGGRLLASAGIGGLRFVFRPSAQLDPVLCSVATRLVRPGDVVWDIGANVGLFSVAAAHLAGPNGAVFAFEADGDAVRLLLATRRLQRPTDALITVVPAAVAAEVGFAQLQIAKRSRSANALKGFGSTQTGGVLETRVVPTFSLDFLLDRFTHPQVLKIDVEGAEALVLRGAMKMLEVTRPVIFCEVSDEASDEVSARFAQFGYVIWNGTQPDWRMAAAHGKAQWDTVAIPAEKAQYFAHEASP